ncbi:MAG TPA: DinB family protein [Thermoanaerobaculia bacterium]|nr:DinB family protein [Thermoanaerobaculia bacterium]
MPSIDAFLAELDYECGTTRRLLERVPEERLDFRPHPRSMSLGRLAGHLAELPGWAAVGLERDEVPMAIEGGGGTLFEPTGHGELLAHFDAGIASLREKVQGIGDGQLREPLRLMRGERIFVELPRRVMLRSVLLNHLIHHRGQLSVYLRLLDVPVPSIYGPSADEERPG